MPLSKMIDLIAEVAAKKIAREGKTKADTSDGLDAIYQRIQARLWSRCRNFASLHMFKEILERLL